MFNESSRPSASYSGFAYSDNDPRRELELELIKIRAEAEAARLDARAAELELTIRRISRDTTIQPELSRVEPNSSDVAATPSELPPQATPSPCIETPQQARRTTTASQPVTAAPFSSWDAVRAAADLAPEAPATSDDQQPTLPISSSAATATPGKQSPRGQPDMQSGVLQRIDAAGPSVARPNLLDLDTAHGESDALPSDQPWDDATATERSTSAVEQRAAQDVEQHAAQDVEQRAAQAEACTTPLLLESADSMSVRRVETGPVCVDAEGEAETGQRRRSPAALLVSSVLHVVILLMLAAFTLQNREPKDQVAISASLSNPSETSIETFQIETSQPEASQAAASEPSETEYELSPIGELQVTELSPAAPPAPPAPAASQLLSSSQMSAASMVLESDSDAKIEFCGVEGGGNHFVYLVDSSRSMREGFESARAELLHSIDVLKPDQRFYVVFFDAQPDYMRLSDANENEPRSAYATAENKQALKRWAMRITKNDGRAPYDPLKFALQLQPDVIFLLSDGEFPQGIEDLLKEQNRVENLFGDSGPISIVHTIGYHSRQGESRMRRIAQQNKGQYRHVPKP